MKFKGLVVAGLLGLAGAVGLSAMAPAQTLRALGGGTSGKLTVPVNRAVVVESDEVFAELSISNPAIADISTLSDRMIYVLGKAPGRTTLTLLSPDGRLLTNVEVRVTPDLSELKERLQQVLPGERIEVRAANDGLILSGTVSSPLVVDRALSLAALYAPGKVSNLLSVGGSQQVMLKVRFAEMNRSVAKSLSTSLAVNGIGGDVGYQGGSNTYTEGSNLFNLFDGDDTTTTTRSESSNGVFAIGAGLGDLEFAVMLEALETKGFVRTLAEPNLTALSGQDADFLAGGEYPVPVSGADGQVTVSFKPFGVSLKFTPRVVGENINLKMDAEVSGIDPTVTYDDGGFSISGFSNRSTSTTVELRDGESFAIAGLLQDDFTSLNGQVPWLGDIPVLGTLFRSAQYQRDQSELVIIVTAHLVTPTRGEALTLPTDRTPLPSESELFLHGRVHGNGTPVQGPAGEVARQDFSGSYGYVME
ncbi:type II and III secretion system protein family protein [Rhodovulum adriaticum]|uniref:Pilus assembly protein CpaC n=1 Tax=Rhodovulum adriaticum TaxID=35804 RepID=A0A4R2NN55_RHOAD|nr:type II and III secretion system protein family protein [Rhodovulum adriaticum]MBK1637132.1 general secretion pathway protein [Rhodovulum adriaticum]TCP22735.1 pilus assembly protein CpaC [Rhodovulum adriaticum]